ncbi:MAG TPA: hypothetical protein V6C97_18055 [Oculatellaceae cyanobacterium]
MFGGGNSRDQGNWTGWLCDQDSMKSIGKQMDPVGYLEVYPKNKAGNLNTLFTGFALFHHGKWYILDRRGSNIAKDLIKRSSTNQGFWVTVEGVRKDNKIKVSNIVEKLAPGRVGSDIVDKGEQNKSIRQDFKRMGI